MRSVDDPNTFAKAERQLSEEVQHLLEATLSSSSTFTTVGGLEFQTSLASRLAN